MNNPFHNSEIIIASDLHLRSPEDSNYQLAVKSMSQIKEAKPTHLVLLGDIFDFYLGSKKYFERKHQIFINAMEEVSAAGIEVIFIEGNHEFHLSDSQWRGITVPDETSYTITTKDGATIKLCHGDLINAPASYLWFRKLIKSNGLKLLVKLVPSRLLDAYALTHARVSRSSDVYRTLNHEALLGDAKIWLERPPKADKGVFGHFHHPYHEVHTDHTLMSLDSWYKPNFLLYRNDQFERIYLN